MRNSLRILGTVLIVAGVLTLAWAVVVWRWEDPFTAIQTYISQKHLKTTYQHRSESFQRTLPAPAHDVNVAWHEAQLAARKYDRTLTRGGPVGRLKIGRLGLDIYVVEGTDHESLKKGPGHYPESALPAQGRLIYIAGHRTTYLAPFAHIDSMRRGDLITLEVPYGSFVYRVFRKKIVASDDLAVLRSHGREVVALQACHPRFFATHRYIVWGRLVRIEPRGATAFTPPSTTLAAAPLASSQG